MEPALGPRAAAVNRWIEVPVLLTALAVAPMFFVELVADEGWFAGAAVVVNWLIWAAFTAESVLLFSLTEHRLAYLRRAWLHVLMIPFAFPLLPAAFSGAIIGDAFRTLRFMVLLVVFIHSCITLYLLLKHIFFDLMAVARHPWVFMLGPLLRKRGLGLVALLFGGLAVAAGLMHSFFEGRHPFEGLWWALVTLTTVGYGDISPVTTGGRITGAALMMSGIAVLAFATASIAAHFVADDHKLDKEVHEVKESLDLVHQRLDRIEELLASGAPVPDGERPG